MVNGVVVERDPLVRRGLSAFVAEHASVLAEVAEVEDAHGWLDGATDVVVGGVEPDDLAVLELALRGSAGAAPPLVLVTRRVTDALVRTVFRAGARGLLLRASVPGHIGEAIDVAARGGTWVDSSVGEVLAALSVKGRPSGTDRRGLTLQERRVLRLLPHGLSNREIAVELGVSVDTVKTHLRHALRKLEVSDRGEAAHVVERDHIC